MKIISYFPISAIFLSFQGLSAATLVAGFDDFISSTIAAVTTASDGVLASHATLAGSGFRSGGKESDTLSYGGDPTLAAGGYGNGRYGLSSLNGERASESTATIIITNPASSIESYTLASFVFDAALRDPTTTPSLLFSVSYQLNSGPLIPLSFTSIASGAFEPLILPVTDILSPGDSVTFTISQVPGQGGQIIIDNIGLIASATTIIPEPTSCVILGLSVALTISRRRRAS